MQGLEVRLWSGNMQIWRRFGAASRIKTIEFEIMRMGVDMSSGVPAPMGLRSRFIHFGPRRRFSAHYACIGN